MTRTLLAVACLAISLSLVAGREVVRRRGRKVDRVPNDLSHWKQLASFDIDGDIRELMQAMLWIQSVGCVRVRVHLHEHRLVLPVRDAGFL